MIRYLGLGGLLVLILWVFCIFDVIATDRSLPRNLPKELWLFLVILFPPIGPIAWLILGRPQGTRLAPGSTDMRPPTRRDQRFLGPEDSPDFLRRADEDRLRAWEEDLRRREEEMRRREDGDER